MRLLSIIAFVGLAAATHVSTHNFGDTGGLKTKRFTCGAGKGGKSCDDCPAGTYSAGGRNAQCQTCPTGMSSEAGSIYCTCNAGYRATVEISGTTCTPCSAGYSSTAGSFFCTPCQANTYSTSGGVCTSCPDGTSASGASSSCTKFHCNAGKYISGNSCANCPSGTYSASADATTCSDCPAGMISSAGSNTCSVCSGGSVPSSTGNTCSACPANTYSSGDFCTPCPAGQTSPQGATTCGPQPSKRAVQPVMATTCNMPGYQNCPVLNGMGGSECINVLTTLDSCGGCVGPEGDDDTYTGRDCTTIPNVDSVKCEAGRCKVAGCRKGYVAGQGTCVPARGEAAVKRAKALLSRHDTF